MIVHLNYLHPAPNRGRWMRQGCACMAARSAPTDIGDEELCNACEREPIMLDGLKRLWTRLAVDLAQRFDGITVANGPLQGA